MNLVCLFILVVLPEGQQDPLEEITSDVPGVRDQPGRDVAVQPIQQMPDQYGFTAPYFSGDDRKSGLAENPAPYHFIRPAARTAEIEEARVRKHGERFPSQA